MDEQIIQDILTEVFSALEPLDAQSAAILQFLKAKGLATEEELAPFLAQAENAANVRWLAARVRISSLLSSALKPAEKAANKSEEKSEEKSEGKSDAKSEGKPEVRSDVKSDGKSAAQSADHSDKKPEASVGKTSEPSPEKPTLVNKKDAA
jgi:hypothetical protein